MSRVSEPMPAARHWRNIPQQVKPRAMSPEGRRRLVMTALRWTGGSAAALLAAWGLWQAAAVWRGDTATLGAAQDALPVQHLVLKTDGVLDQAWLARTLALPARVTLTQLNLAQLRARVLTGGQVREATLSRDFPSTLTVRVGERTPVARILAQGPQGPLTLVVARDGVVYAGEGYAAALLSSLPYLDGIKLVRRGAGFAPIPGVSVAADLLNRARFDAPHLYRAWQVVSLARLQSDGEIEVRTSSGLKVIFGTQEEFFRQLARLDLLLDTAQARGAGPIAQVNLSLPRQSGVPVTFANPAPAPVAAARPAARPKSHPN